MRPTMSATLRLPSRSTQATPLPWEGRMLPRLTSSTSRRAEGGRGKSVEVDTLCDTLNDRHRGGTGSR